MHNLNKLCSRTAHFPRFAIHVSFPCFTNIYHHHANMTWLYSTEPLLMIDGKLFQSSVLRAKLVKLNSIWIWILIICSTSSSANPSIIFAFHWVTFLCYDCYDYRFIQTINDMLVFVLTSWCKSNHVPFFELNWLSVDPNRISYSMN